MNTIEVKPILLSEGEGKYPSPILEGRVVATVGVENVLDALREQGYIVIGPKRLPEVVVDANGKPRLPSTEQNARNLSGMTRGSRYRVEAYEKLALAAWYDARDAERKALRTELESDLAKQGVEFSDRVADDLIAAGWHK